MKLHKVEIHNLNSLYGEHLIDFDHDLGRSPLFLIVGPTGAGKSTILDAICLALFGQTPRLSRRSGQPDTDTGHIMSYGTGRCRALVEFSKRGPDGERQRFRAVWECRRAREKPEGNLQDPERSLTRIHEDGAEELLISDKRRKYFDPVFEEALEGLTVEDFQRSVLLAQGQFAAFLQADEQVKASILERLTNTDEYRRIGQRAARKRRDAERDLQQVQAQLDGIQILTEQEERDLADALEHLLQELEALKHEHAQLARVTEWLQLERQLQQRLHEAQQQLQQTRHDLAERADDIARHDEDERCQHAQAPLHELDALEHDLHRLRDQLAQALLQHQQAQQELAAASSLDAQAQEKLTLALDRLEQLRPTLERGLDLEHGLDSARQELDRVKTQQREELEQRALAQAALEQRRADLALMQEALTKHQQTLAARAHLDALPAAVEQLRAQVGLSDALARDAHAARARAAQAADKVNDLERALALAQERIAQERAQIDPLEQRHQQLTRRERELLGPQGDVRAARAQLEAALEAARQEGARQERGLHSLERLVTQTPRQVALRDQLHALLKRQEHTQEQLAHKLDKHQVQLDLVRAQEKLVRLLDQRLALADHRRDLEPGDPCPLCGAHDHPFLTHDAADALEREQHAQRDEATQELAELRARQERLEQDLRQSQLVLAQIEAERRALEPQRATLEQDIAQELERLNPIVVALGLPAQAAFPEQATAQQLLRMQLTQRRDAAALDAAQARQQLDALSALLSDLEDAARALRQARDAIAEQLAHVQTLEATLRSERDALAEWTQRADTAQAKAQDHAQAILERFATLAIPAASADAATLTASSPAQALALAEQALLAHSALLTLEADARAARDQAQQAQAQAQRELALVEDKLQAIERDLVRRGARIEQDQQELDALLDGQSARALRARHESDIQHARQTHEELRERVTLARERASREASIHQERQAQHEQRQALPAPMTQQLTAMIEALGLPDRHALRQRLLPHEQRAALRHALRELRAQLTRAELQLESVTASLAQHHALATDPPELRQRDLLDLISARAALEGKLEAQHEDIGAVRQRLLAQRDARERSAALIESYQTKLAEYRVWETINKLIGQRDGESFKQFAQSLNLQDLVDRANVRLKRLAARYKLAVATGEAGEPRLHFAVRDQHHAGFERPVTTLSGGETFLVSLALALALADFKRIDMPVETLLLDEGFGTLDQETLDVAMHTLSQLQQESAQQIGIISHVESLKERVDTRIVVEKLGNGRSDLRVEHANWILG